MNRATRSDAVWSIDDLELELRKLPGVRAAGFDDCDDMLLVQLHVADRTENISRSDRTDQPVPVSAARIAARHSDRPVTVEVVRWRNAPLAAPYLAPIAAPEAPPSVRAPERRDEAEAESESEVEPDEADRDVALPAAEEIAEPTRTRLLAVLAFPDTDELEVHLIFEGKRTIGRASVSRGIEGAVEATIEAVRDLGTGVEARVRWARAVEDAGNGDQEVVAVALDGVDTRSPMRYGLASGTSLIDAAARATLDALNRHLTRTR